MSSTSNDQNQDTTQDNGLAIGSVWRHHNGNEYIVLAVANTDGYRQDEYPPTVLYRGLNGRKWARRLSDWRRSMTFVSYGPPRDHASELAQMTARKDEAYHERNKVVAALARLFPSGTAKTAIPGWSDDWHGCVYIDLPTGQVSWHFHDSQAYLFEALPAYQGEYDGHDTEEKYRRLGELHGLVPNLGAAQHVAEALFDYTDQNLVQYEAFADSVPDAAYHLYGAARLLKEFLAFKPGPEPIAWRYELAGSRVYEGPNPVGWDNWRWYIAESKPNVPAGSIRNLKPLFALDAGISETATTEASHILCIGMDTLRRLAAGEAVWIDGVQAGAVPADDFPVDAVLAGLPITERSEDGNNFPDKGNVFPKPRTDQQQTDHEKGTAKTHIKLNRAEIQSGLDRVQWAEGLIRQLPTTHDGRNSWLLNYSKDKHEADKVSLPVDPAVEKLAEHCVKHSMTPHQCFGMSIWIDVDDALAVATAEHMARESK